MSSVKQKEAQKIEKAYNINSIFYSTVVRIFIKLTKQSNKMFVLNEIVLRILRI